MNIIMFLFGMLFGCILSGTVVLLWNRHENDAASRDEEDY
jgi:hypothetical protein